MEKDQVAELCYHLPEAAHERLCQTREEIRLLADLTARINEEAGPLQLSPNALAGCFDRLSADTCHRSPLPQSRWNTNCFTHVRLSEEPHMLPLSSPPKSKCQPGCSSGHQVLCDRGTQKI